MCRLSIVYVFMIKNSIILKVVYSMNFCLYYDILVAYIQTKLDLNTLIIITSIYLFVHYTLYININ